MVMPMHLDRLPGLVQHRAGKDLHKIGIADGHRQRRVLGDVEVLARQRRDDDAHRLRDDDQPQRLAGRKSERGGGLGLALARQPGCRRARSRR